MLHDRLLLASAHRLARLVAALAIVTPLGGCGSAPSRTPPAEPVPPAASTPAATATPTETAQGSAADPAPSASPPPSAALATAPPAPAVDVRLPPDAAALARRFADPAVLSRVRAFVVDESCLLVERIPEKARRAQTGPVGLAALEQDGRPLTNAETPTDTPQELTALRAFVDAFPAGQHHFAIQRTSWQNGDKTVYQWRALCLPQEPLFGGASNIGRIRLKDGTFDATEFRVGFGPAAIARIQSLPREALRLALLHDEDVLVVLPVDRLKELSSPSVLLVKLAP